MIRLLPADWAIHVFMFLSCDSAQGPYPRHHQMQRRRWSIFSFNLPFHRSFLTMFFIRYLPKTDALRPNTEELRSRDHPPRVPFGSRSSWRKVPQKGFILSSQKKRWKKMNVTDNYMTVESISQSYLGITFSYKLTKCNITVLKCLLVAWKGSQNASALLMLVCSSFNLTSQKWLID